MYETDIGEAHYSAFHVFSTFRIAISPLKVKCTYFCVAISPPPRHPSHIQYPIFKLRKYEYSRWTVHCRDCLSSGGEEARWVTSFVILFNVFVLTVHFVLVECRNCHVAARMELGRRKPKKRRRPISFLKTGKQAQRAGVFRKLDMGSPLRIVTVRSGHSCQPPFVVAHHSLVTWRSQCKFRMRKSSGPLDTVGGQRTYCTEHNAKLSEPADFAATPAG
ncbi:hypothetical protein J6590_103133, partial [Homalodisca vitripennis]